MRHRGTPVAILAAHAPTGGSLDPELIVDSHVPTPALYGGFIQYSDLTETLTALCLREVESEMSAASPHPNKMLRQNAYSESVKIQSLAFVFCGTTLFYKLLKYLRYGAYVLLVLLLNTYSISSSASARATIISRPRRRQLEPEHI